MDLFFQARDRRNIPGGTKDLWRPAKCRPRRSLMVISDAKAMGIPPRRRGCDRRQANRRDPSGSYGVRLLMPTRIRTNPICSGDRAFIRCLGLSSARPTLPAVEKITPFDDNHG
jgi:hypothetical protein